MLNIDSILMAQKRIEPYIYKTPIIPSQNLGEILGCEVFIKPECMQRTNSFKIRGALNKMLSMPKDEVQRGVVAASSGNHGKGVAFAAKLLGVKATIVIPDTAPQIKVDGIKDLGAEVIQCKLSERHIIANELSEKYGYINIHPYNDYDIMAGQGTIGLEIVEQLKDVDTVVVPIGGGGLIAGISTAVKSKLPDVKIVGAEPYNLRRYAKSIEAGERVQLEEQKSEADALLTSTPGEKNYPIVSSLVSEFVGVKDEYLLKAMKLLLMEGKILAEPSSCIGIGAILQGELKVKRDEKICFVVSGGNTGIDKIKELEGISI
ncbi:threonine dehydratase [Anaerosphaera aminiphila DSM 21120]|uniref:threonine ammonia-lyase n=1 Tax=Anaerosphaera aminiphila DSM 21120 TaxID=1120995 RepID=A0A1M5V0I7_9FIRM|nr:threonine/serine dehydratase [Anaerosphaera aminiphila]SHH68817.1 threonine dehydratase [Anaerosphaera aminiphila DSM 21120]